MTKCWFDWKNWNIINWKIYKSFLKVYIQMEKAIIKFDHIEIQKKKSIFTHISPKNECI